MRHASLTMAEQVRRSIVPGEQWEVLFCSDMLSLAEFRGLAPASVAQRLGVGLTGLSETEVAERLTRFGPNRLEPPPPPSRWRILLRQFQSPLIYVLLAAAAVALALGELTDAGFIAAVLMLNASIGFVNEYRAEREVQALSGLVRTRARVRRGGRSLDIDGEQLVPGDLLMLESGMRVGADVRFVEARGMRIDESVLTGESVPVEKDEAPELPADTVLAERRNMCFAGSIVASGRGLGLVVATGTHTEVGRIASQVGAVRYEPPPLLRRMEHFAKLLGAIALAFTSVLVVIGLAWGQPTDRNLRDQYTLEVFYRIYITPQMHVSPDFQLIINPSQSPDRDVVGVFGVRVRWLF